MSRSQGMYDRHITIFSPEGKLFQVEYAFKAVKGANLTAIAVKGEDTAVIVAQKKIPMAQQAQQDKLLDTSYITSMHHVTDSVGGCMVGVTGDCRAMLYRARQIAADFNFEKGYPMPIHYLTQKVANLNQLYTQHAYMRLHACTGIMVAIDDETGPSIYRFDPAGWYAGYKACSAGTKEQEATNALEKLIKKKSGTCEKETVQSAISCLQTVLSVDFKPHDLEVGVVTVANPKFRKLEEKEIEEYLNAIAEAD